MNKHVYFILAPTEGLVKIGVAVDVKARLSALRSSCPVPLTLLGCIRNGGGEMEKRIHSRFAEFRSHGEWFRHEGPLAKYIETNLPSETPAPARDSREDRMVAMSVRLLESKLKALEVISRMRGHADVSETMREVTDMYIESHLRRMAA